MKKDILNFLYQQVKLFVRSGMNVSTAVTYVYEQSNPEIDGFEIDFEIFAKYVNQKIEQEKEDEAMDQIDAIMQGDRI